ncbi:MAG TPA: radical SAM protein [Nitratifractor sp.]|nr:radical SAM protein [Nitratifractor sp.]
MSKTIFGPVNSRRFGKSLGVDLSPGTKQCNFDCLYCELEPAKTLASQSSVVPLKSLVSDIQEALESHKNIDVLTITANGEPTLYPYLDELIEEINKFKGSTKTLILSNGSTIADPVVQKALLKFDSVKLSLDCATSSCFKKLDRPESSINLEQIKEGMLAFKKIYSGNLLIEILFVKDLNDNEQEVAKLNEFLLQLQPTRVDIGTIDRPPAYKISPVSYEKLHQLSFGFDSSLHIAIATKAPTSLEKFDYTKEEILNTLARRPLTQSDIEALFNKNAQKHFQELLSCGKIVKQDSSGVLFYKVA